MTRKNDLTGMIFSRLTVLGDSGERRNGAVLWLCRCRCGRKCTAAAYELNGKKVKSCGCLRQEAAPRKLRRAGYMPGRGICGPYVTMADFDELETY